MGLSWVVDGNERSMIDARYWFGSSLIAVATQSRTEIYLFTREPKSLKVVQKIKADQQEGGGGVIRFKIALNYSRTVDYITRKLSIVFNEIFLRASYTPLSFVSLLSFLRIQTCVVA
jgi:hypothetical protein